MSDLGCMWRSHALAAPSDVGRHRFNEDFLSDSRFCLEISQGVPRIEENCPCCPFESGSGFHGANCVDQVLFWSGENSKGSREVGFEIDISGQDLGLFVLCNELRLRN